MILQNQRLLQERILEVEDVNAITNIFMKENCFDVDKDMDEDVDYRPLTIKNCRFCIGEKDDEPVKIKHPQYQLYDEWFVDITEACEPGTNIPTKKFQGILTRLNNLL